ncbi:MAG: glutathione S-transferase [Rhodobacteraceae bacterium]|nr:glutathione S-transferase [Paracoccaceae bacterium]
MKLFYAPTSPYVRKIMIALIETGQLEKVEMVPVKVSPINPGDIVPDNNPLGKIPCLIRNNGKPIFDSRVICRYLDTMHNGAKLYPNDSTLWDTLTLEALGEGINEAAILIAYERMLRPEAQQSSDWIEAQWLKISRALDSIENDWMVHLNGTPDMACYGIGAALGYLDLRHDDRGWRDNHLKLATWEAGFAKRPAMVSTVPELPK